MTTAWKLLFFGSVLMLVYVYIGYPLFVAFLSLLKKKKVNKAFYEPSVAILIAAYNEEGSIRATLNNKLSLSYPRGKLEIIVISDGCTDRTAEIVAEFQPCRVRLLRQEPRQGKTAALNLAVPETSAEIIVFSDANSMYDRVALRNLVRNFSDPSVGYVTGKMIYRNPDGSGIGEGCSAYMKYENFLRKMETGVGSVVGVDGGVDAVRKSLYSPMRPDQLPDFVLPLKVVEQGYRVVYEPEAILKESALTKLEDEYGMRVRVALRALWGLLEMHQLLSFRRYKFFAWQLWSHKVLRYFCFLFFLGVYLSNVALYGSHSIYRVSFMLQNLFYLAAFLSPFLEKKGHRIRILQLANYLVLINVAAAHGAVKLLLGQRQVTWTPRKG